MQRKHLWLVAVLLGIFIAASLGWSAGAQAAAPVCTISNKSGYPDNQVYICYTANSGGYYHYDWNTSAFLASQTSDNKVSVDGTLYCEYYISLDKLNKFKGKPSFTLVIKDGARLWISLGKQLYFRVRTDDTVEEPDPVNDSLINYSTLFDVMELTYNGSGVTMNTSCVDAFCLPLMFELKDGDNIYGPLGLNHPRAVILNALKGHLTGLASLTDNGVRVLAPIKSPALDHTYFKNYVDYCWDTVYQSPKSFQVNVRGYTWTGTVSGDTLTFTGTGGTYTIARPTDSWDIIADQGPFVGSDANDSQLKNEVNMALNRSVFHVTTTPEGTTTLLADWQTESKFYKQNGLPDDKYRPNRYSQILHSLAIDRKIYGFTMDEGGWASKIENQPATEAIVIINSCKSITAPMDSLLLDGN